MKTTLAAVAAFSAIFLGSNLAHAQVAYPPMPDDKVLDVAKGDADDVKIDQLLQMTRDQFIAHEVARSSMFFDPTKDDFPYYHTAHALHTVRLINDGVNDLELRLRVLERATKNINYMVYQFNYDTSGQLILKTLIDRAQKGVKIRLLVDYNMAHTNGLDEKRIFQIQQYVTAALVGSSGSFEIRYYNPGTFLTNITKATYRNHTKVFTVDGRELMMGGRNTGDEYFQIKLDGFNYVDRDAWVTSMSKDPMSNVVLEAEQAFDGYWNDSEWVKPAVGDSKAQGVLFAGKSDADFKTLRATIHAATSASLGESSAELAGTQDVPTFTARQLTFVIDRPGHAKEHRRVTPAVHYRIAQATQYFVSEQWTMPMSQAKQDIFNYLTTKNQVPVLFLTNGVATSENSGLTALAENTEFDMLKSMKLFWSFDLSGKVPTAHVDLPGFAPKSFFATHAKDFVVFNKEGGDYTFIGSYNFDERSELLNNEEGLIIENCYPAAAFIAGNIVERMEVAHQLMIGPDWKPAYVDRAQLKWPQDSILDVLARVFGLKKFMREEY